MSTPFTATTRLFSNIFKINTPLWREYSTDELNNRLRTHIIYQAINGIDNSYVIAINGKNHGAFTYKNGVILN